jgi:hypothetical protein
MTTRAIGSYDEAERGGTRRVWRVRIRGGSARHEGGQDSPEGTNRNLLNERTMLPLPSLDPLTGFAVWRLLITVANGFFSEKK